MREELLRLGIPEVLHPHTRVYGMQDGVHVILYPQRQVSVDGTAFRDINVRDIHPTTSRIMAGVCEELFLAQTHKITVDSYLAYKKSIELFSQQEIRYYEVWFHKRIMTAFRRVRFSERYKKYGLKNLLPKHTAKRFLENNVPLFFGENSAVTLAKLDALYAALPVDTQFDQSFDGLK